MHRSIITFPLIPSQLAKLLKHGFEIAEDVTNWKPGDLCKAIGVTLEEAAHILQTLKEETFKHQVNNITVSNKNQTAFELLLDESYQLHVVSFSEKLDKMLGGGIPICQITECSGAPGSGKTQLCMQLAIAVQVPECIGGLQGDAIYIDTEGSFVTGRVIEMATAAIRHCQKISEDNLLDFSLESILQRISYFRCYNSSELIALMYTLPAFLKEHPNVRLITVDSIAFHFRHGFDDFALRNRLLAQITQSFLRLAFENHVAVVFTNQMTTKIDREGARLVPALGDSWGYLPTNRIILSHHSSEYQARIFKSASLEEATVRFQITNDGIRDV